MNKVICFQILHIICFTSLEAFNLTPHKNSPVRVELIVNQLTERVAQNLLLNNDLHLIGTGGQMMSEIEVLAIDFDYSKEVDLTQARYLLITAIQSYMNEINQNKEVRRYLKKYPFTAENIEIGIYIHEPSGADVPKDQLFYLSAVDGVLYYYLVNPKRKTLPKITFHQETYEGAVKTLSSSSKLK